MQVRGLLTIPGFSADRALETVTSPLLRQSIVEMLTTLTTSEQDTWPDALHKVRRMAYMVNGPTCALTVFISVVEGFFEYSS